MERKISIALLVAAAIIFAFLYWLFSPAINIGLFGSAIFIEIAIIVAISLGTLLYTEDFDYFAGTFAVVFAVFLVIDLICLLIGSTLFNSDVKYRQLGNGNPENIHEVEYTSMIESIDTSQIPIVDEGTARVLADKKLGEETALGSRVRLGDGAIMEVNGEIMWVFPLEHKGFFKWNANHSTPGFITVSASNTSKVMFYNNYNIMYSQSSYFGYNLKRHLRRNGCFSDGLTEYTFELDDEMNPIWVVTIYKNTTLWGTPEATGIVTCDAQTGKVIKYALDEIPEWVDVVQPKDFIEKQINNWGKLVHGLFNWADTDKIMKTDQLLTVYNDGDCYYFTGMTSTGADSSVVGFVMVNTRTKETYMSKIGGATEDAAMQAAQSLWSDFGYVAIEPMPINADGVPTYAVALKSPDSRLIVAYAMVNIKDMSISAKGETLTEAAKAYSKKLATAGISYAASDKAYSYDLEGEILRISSEVQDGETYYTFIIKDNEEKLFTCGYNISDELAITREGDKVSIKYVDDGNGSFSVTEFDNIEFKTVTSENQERRDELDKDSNYENQVLPVDSEQNDLWWNSLTDEEKAEIISQLNSKGE